MKNKITIFVMALLVFTPLVIAQESQFRAGVTPDNRIFYGIDRALERVRMAFTFGDENKVNYGLKVAEERLAEIKAMHEVDNPYALERARIGYEKINSVIGNKTQVSENLKIRVRERTQTQIIELRKILTNTQEQSKAGLQNAIENSEIVRGKFK